METSPFKHPNWAPQTCKGMRLLIVGATGGIGRSLVKMLLRGSDCVLGLHGNSVAPSWEGERVIPLRGSLSDESSCNLLVQSFTAKAGQIDGIVVLAGGIRSNVHWSVIAEQEWEKEIQLHLNVPFYLARAAMRAMKKNDRRGRVILTGTESALHGGDSNSFPYGIAKRGIECMVQGLARDGAPNGILVNGVRLGFIASGFHERWQGKSSKNLAKRVKLVPLQRAGTPEEAAALIAYLLSEWASFMTGQMISLSGGDWL